MRRPQKVKYSVYYNAPIGEVLVRECRSKTEAEGLVKSLIYSKKEAFVKRHGDTK